MSVIDTVKRQMRLFSSGCDHDLSQAFSPESCPFIERKHHAILFAVVESGDGSCKLSCRRRLTTRIADNSGIAADMNGAGDDRPAVTTGSTSVVIDASWNGGDCLNMVSVGCDTQQRQTMNVAACAQGIDSVNLNQPTWFGRHPLRRCRVCRRGSTCCGSQLQQIDLVAKQGIAVVGALASNSQLDRDVNCGMGIGLRRSWVRRRWQSINMQVCSRRTWRRRSMTFQRYSDSRKVIGAGMLYEWKNALSTTRGGPDGMTSPQPAVGFSLPNH
ncbi:hypothetical protein KDW07_25345 [Burkholderia dolosa]|uniref:hypothetical protein n=1 Tax=Burkholderia dolosa TaxID=152500 RepID=UPI0015927C21|nr:hypothetical protein [Burkholderia dolosa]MBR8460478.1 hypothetical protein [Burkholderia dolosa]